MDRNHKPLLCDVWHDLSWPFFTQKGFSGQALERFLFHPNWRMQSIIHNTLESILLRGHRLFCVMFRILYRLHDVSWPFFTQKGFSGQALAKFLFHPNWRMQSIIGNTLESILLRGHRLHCVTFGILHDFSWPFFNQKAFYGQVVAKVFFHPSWAKLSLSSCWQSPQHCSDAYCQVLNTL